ncbi:hypothetical protein ABID23_000812 [Bartonella silvatica]|uniref:Uncharacterized protein n=2 Tax=Bartonella silvatica TaxID=357760 RepID=A0ABV2HGQ3_9HYPH
MLIKVKIDSFSSLRDESLFIQNWIAQGYYQVIHQLGILS